MQFPGAPERVRMHEVVRGLIDWLVSGLSEGTMAAARAWRMLKPCGRIAERVVRFYVGRRPRGRAQLKRFLRAQVYESERVGARNGRPVRAAHPRHCSSCYLDAAGR